MRNPLASWAQSWGRALAGQPAASLREFVKQGPLARHVEVADETEWAGAAAELATNLGVTPERATADQRACIFHWYLPVLFWLTRLRGNSGGGCSIVGLSAPQGCGKTTLTQSLVTLLNSRGVRTVAISLDDFYLTGGEQDALAAAHPRNPLLKNRGNAGTHDISLCTRVLTELRASGPGSTTMVPRYDKAARGGRGDRAAREQWTRVTGAVDMVLFEGWMLGFSPLPPDALPRDGAATATNTGDSSSDGGAAQRHPAALAEVNAKLQAYTLLHAMMDAWIVVRVGDPSWVRRWRAEAERAMAARGTPGMTPEQVDSFVDGFMPAYRAYLPGLYGGGPQGGAGKPLLSVCVDAQRRPVRADEV